MTSTLQPCVPETFGALHLAGSQISSVLANVVENATFQLDGTFRLTQPDFPATNFDYCNVTVAYTHTGETSTIVIEMLLPTESLNGRMIAVGGSGFAAGRGVVQQWQMLANVAEGYATVTTDAGVGIGANADSWALLGPGQVDDEKLKNLASVSLEDMACADNPAMTVL